MSPVPSPAVRRYGFFGALRRIGLVRLLVMGFVIVMGMGATYAFHFEYLGGHLGFGYLPWIDIAATLSLCLGLMGLYALLVKLFEARWPAEARPGGLWLLLGVLIGVGLFCAVYAILAALGVARFEGMNGWGGLYGVLLVSVVAGTAEELLCRGVLFRVLEDSFGTTVALVVSAAVFGLLHGANPGASLVSTAAIAVEAGVMLAAAYAWSRNLWFVIGLHLAWNFTEGGIFGAAISGGKAKGLLNFPLSKTASPLITGGVFGPEASVVAVGVCVALAAVFLTLAVRAGRWQGLKFRLLIPD
jgi:membrane protease YdiL (CAAX protease family)